ncbi:hypothetical protein AMK17_37770 [Streptomyces sp. CB00072]|uniref:hypothetical protein n=1 Tax=Streptomyces sp. CB00072 TaxID=1703928 RepID=UPI0009389F17|nr:hypothetical protein [Streptomyces sp. CB00072]OKI49412.1 hypothetical protein AMK17_37770 [Streptomyces sp. CB00072]
MDSHEIDEIRRALDSYEMTQRRLRAAGERAAAADVMRRAAVAEMGQAIRDHRQILEDVAGAVDRRNWRMDMEQAETLTGMTRRTLSTAVADDSARSDAEVASEYRAYRYDEHHGGEELHRRYPHLAGLHQARRLLSKEILRKYEEAHPEDLLGFDLDPGLSAEEQLLLDEYERQVDAIADSAAVESPTAS